MQIKVFNVADKYLWFETPHVSASGSVSPVVNLHTEVKKGSFLPPLYGFFLRQSEITFCFWMKKEPRSLTEAHSFAQGQSEAALLRKKKNASAHR